MAVAPVDTSSETAESLESGRAGGQSAWLKQQTRRLVGGITGFIGIAVGSGFTVFYWSVLKGWFETQSDGTIMLFLLVMGLVAGGLWAFGVAFGATLSLWQGLPKASRKPEEAIRAFLVYCLPGPKPSPREQTIEAEGYLLLLDGAKQQVLSFANFKAYWTGVRDTLLKDVGKRLLVKQLDFIRCWSHEVKPAGQEHGLSIYEALILIRGYFRRSRWGSVREESAGMVCYRERFSVAEVDGRWYLTSPYWSGEQVKSDAVWPFPV